jgi:acyl-CoA thioester hydrolase
MLPCQDLPMSQPFRVRIAVRGYELDVQGHVNQAVYLQYAEHARWECLRAAGLRPGVLAEAGVGPVQLECTIRYFRELRAGDEVDVSCGFMWGESKTFRLEQEYLRPDGTPVANLTGVAGVLDLHTRRLLADPAERFRSLASAPEYLGLA